MLDEFGMTLLSKHLRTAAEGLRSGKIRLTLKEGEASPAVKQWFKDIETKLAEDLEQRAAMYERMTIDCDGAAR